MRIKYEDLIEMLQNILLKYNVNDSDSLEVATMFAQNSLDGIYSHGANRFPVFIDAIKKGHVLVDNKLILEDSFGGFERWNGNQGIGILNAKASMNRALELSKENGIGIVALNNTNHWMRGGAYGWQAADSGMIGICWTNTNPNMPAWGGIEPRIGNNPLVISVPKSNGKHIVLDMAMSQFAYGKIEDMRMKKLQLPVHGGFDTNGNLTTDPAEIESTGRVLPTGYWKGSGLSILIDLVGSILAKGRSVKDIGDLQAEYGITQIFIAINPNIANSIANVDKTIDDTIKYIKSATPDKEGGSIYYPGEIEYETRYDNLKNGIPILQEVLDKLNKL